MFQCCLVILVFAVHHTGLTAKHFKGAAVCDIFEVVIFIAPPQLPPVPEMYVAVEVKVTVKVTESLNSAN